jgi:bifunctional DNA-binding transcriptional regulator/antitoxin component of YhaV-PrlF toxin-antitoxin module
MNKQKNTGYSGTPLAKKLGIKPGAELHVISEPNDYRELLAPLPDDVKFVRAATTRTTIVHLFVTERVRLAEALRKLRGKLQPDAAIWVSWPKKAAKVATDITEDTIREVALPLGFVDIKVCAVDATWSGLKLVVRKELR